MPRKKRREGKDAIHHACGHGVNDEAIFSSDEDRAGYVAMLAATVKRYRWRCLSYCLMTTHVHLLIETPDANLGEGIRWMHGRYGAAFNDQHDRDGHLFQGRYHSELVEDEAHLVNVAGYIPMNPVEAGLCRDPREWRWGSHFSVASGNPKPWLAHDHLVSRLDAIAGPGTYEQVIRARLLTRFG